jgi:hypothetical protein
VRCFGKNLFAGACLPLEHHGQLPRFFQWSISGSQAASAVKSGRNFPKRLRLGCNPARFANHTDAVSEAYDVANLQHGAFGTLAVNENPVRAAEVNQDRQRPAPSDLCMAARYPLSSQGGSALLAASEDYRAALE